MNKTEFIQNISSQIIIKVCTDGLLTVAYGDAIKVAEDLSLALEEKGYLFSEDRTDTIPKKAAHHEQHLLKLCQQLMNARSQQDYVKFLEDYTKTLKVIRPQINLENIRNQKKVGLHD